MGGRTVGAPLRLLVVTPRFFPDVGGVERNVYETVRRLAARGVDVTVLATDRTRRRPRGESLEGVDVIRVPAWPSQRDYYIAPGVYDVVAGGQWDIVHVQSWHTPVAPLTMLACIRSSLPYVVTPHGRGYSGAVRSLIRPAQRRLLLPLLRRSKQVIAVAQFERELLVHDMGLDPDLVKLIPNGSDLSAPTPSPAPVDGPIIASVGRLEKFKGHHRILRALPFVLEERPDVRLAIVGEGPYEVPLRELAARLGVTDRVTIVFFPLSERDRLTALVDSAALVVLLSEFETHPVAALEAAALGKPVLVSDVAGMREMADGGLAVAIPLETAPREVARVVVEQLARPHKPPALRLPTWDECTEALLEVYVRHARRSRNVADAGEFELPST